MHCSSALQLRENSFDKHFGNDTTAGLSKQDSAFLTAGILPVFYPQGGAFFLEGQPARGVFLLRTGRAKESVISSRGKTAIVRVVGPGVILGLAPVLRGEPYDSTVEALEPTHADFVAKAAFLRVLKTSGQLAQAAASQLSRTCRETYAAIRCLGTSESASERLARLLLQWADCPLPNHDGEMPGIRIRVTFTQEEIGQFTGSTRETISRILAEFREKKWIDMNGSIWTIINADEIRRLAGI
jgi:CRP/FNR family transcriptional regulator, cyclic AMP receptor protein